MLDKVRAWIERYLLITPGDRVLAACSGGPDSLTLVHILNRLKGEYQFSLAVAHVNHMFRLEAAAEAEFVARFCANLGLECHVQAIDVPAYLAVNSMSSQEAARLLRYNYLRQVAQDWGGAQIATGHHRDDQVETVLINLLRGAGSGGLKGMRVKSDDIIRPLLSVSRRDIEEYCAVNGLNPCQDSSNFKTDYLRNRIRLKLLPLIEKDYNPAIREALWRTAGLAGAEHDYIAGEAAKLWGSVAGERDGKIYIDSSLLATAHTALRREIIRQAVEKKRGRLTGISFDHVEKLLTMALSGTVGSVVTLPGGLIARKTYTGLEFEDSTPDKPLCRKDSRSGSSVKPVVIKVPGCIEVHELGVAVIAEVAKQPPRTHGPEMAVFDLDALELPLVVRTRLTGDRFRPLGLGGSKKLKDFFIDAKVPQVARDKILVVADQHNIIWIAGYRQSEYGQVAAQTGNFLTLTVTK